MPGHETTAPASAVRTYGSGWHSCTLAQPQKSWSLRASGDFTTLKNMFAQIVVTRVVAVVTQSQVTGPETEGASLPTQSLDFGLSERDRSDLDFGLMPDFHTITVGGASPQTQRVVWGEGGEPFPTGLQLDLRLAEQRFKWPAFFIGHEHHEAGNNFELVRYKVFVTVNCQMQASSS
jgi:hypothetical protein